MKLSEEIKELHKSGEAGNWCEGWAERAEAMENALSMLGNQDLTPQTGLYMNLEKQHSTKAKSMKKDAIQRYLAEYKQAIIDDVNTGDDSSLVRTLKMLMKDVDRDARHNASEVLGRASRDIINS